MAAPKGLRDVGKLQAIMNNLRGRVHPKGIPLLDKADDILANMDGSTGKQDEDRRPRPRVKIEKVRAKKAAAKRRG